MCLRNPNDRKHMTKTTVVNVYCDKYDVYIGRAGKGQDGVFGNPYSGPDRDANIKLFRTYFYDRLKNDKEFAAKILQLRGKRLGCFCRSSNPKRSSKPCHGDVIAQYLDSLPEPNPLKLAVVGDLVDYAYMCQILSWFEIKQIISGDDALAKKYAEENALNHREFPAEWDKYGKSAGYKRDVKIVDTCDEIVVFNSKSKLVQHIIDIAEEQSKPVHIMWKDELSMLR